MLLNTCSHIFTSCITGRMATGMVIQPKLCQGACVNPTYENKYIEEDLEGAISAFNYFNTVQVVELLTTNSEILEKFRFSYSKSPLKPELQQYILAAA